LYEGERGFTDVYSSRPKKLSILHFGSIDREIAHGKQSTMKRSSLELMLSDLPNRFG
jgi:hypothetical protein